VDLGKKMLKTTLDLSDIGRARKTKKLERKQKTLGKKENFIEGEGRGAGIFHNNACDTPAGKKAKMKGAWGPFRKGLKTMEVKKGSAQEYIGQN